MRMIDKDSDGANTFGEYIIQGDVSMRQRAENWRIAIGLQGVDQLANSKYLLETAREQIEGRLNFAGVEKRISDYYKTAEGRALIESRSDEADLVATHIAELLVEDTFTLSPAEYVGVHKRLFSGVLKHAGQYRTHNISKPEWVLDNRSVVYASAQMISDTIIYDFEQEKAFSYKGLSSHEVVKHIAKFISGLWEIHPFYEGNTRTTAVFTIRYLRRFGFAANNDLFQEKSLYFRNALVRAVYESYQYKISPNPVFLERFFDNLLFNGHHKLLNRHCHIYWQEEIPTEIPTKNVALSEKMSEKTAGDVGENTSVSENIISMIIDDNEISANKIARKLNLASRTIERHIEKLKAVGRLRRIGPDKGGHWEVIEQ